MKKKFLLIIFCIIAVLLAGTAISCTDLLGVTISYYVDSTQTVMEQKTVADGVAYQLPVLEKAGYTFLGYYDNPISGNLVVNEHGNSLMNANRQNNPTLYPTWRANEYTISIVNALTNEPINLPTIKVTYGDTLDNGLLNSVWNLIKPANEKYEFSGLFESLSADGRQVADGTQWLPSCSTLNFSGFSPVDGDTITLYAHRGVKQFTVYFYTPDDDTLIASKKVPYGTVLNSAEGREYYPDNIDDFDTDTHYIDRWVLSDNNNSTQDPNWQLTNNNLSVKGEMKEYVTFDIVHKIEGISGEIATTTHKGKATYTVPKASAILGNDSEDREIICKALFDNDYSVNGLNLNNAIVSEQDEKKTIDESGTTVITYTYPRKTFTIHLYVDGKEWNTVSVEYLAYPTKPSNPSKEFYWFYGWNYDENKHYQSGSYKFDSPMPAEDVYVNASFGASHYVIWGNANPESGRIVPKGGYREDYFSLNRSGYTDLRPYTKNADRTFDIRIEVSMSSIHHSCSPWVEIWNEYGEKVCEFDLYIDTPYNSGTGRHCGSKSVNGAKMTPTMYARYADRSSGSGDAWNRHLFYIQFTIIG